ncbi:MAG: NUDIX hydrolase [Burkholderiales bacterium]|nr:NUDIX hydrolase [Burkholderiales bacterium]
MTGPASAQDFPVPPRDAATVVLLRDGAEALELYLVKRSRAVDFMAGAHVFPGGRLDEAHDAAPEALARLGVGVEALAARLGETLAPARAAGLFVAAIRETFEEAGVLFGRLAPGWAAPAARTALGAGTPFAALVARLDAGALVPWLRWVTPQTSPRRFDARFFLARAPEGEEPQPDGREAVAGLWISPRRALERWASGELQLAPATARSIDALADFGSVEEALVAAAARPPPAAMPIVWRDDDGRTFVSLPGDPRHPDADAMGGRIRRVEFAEGRYRPVPAG